MSKKTAPIPDNHPVKSLSFGTCQKVAVRLKISRPAAFFKLVNYDEKAWAIALEVEKERAQSGKHLLSQLNEIRASSVM